MSSKKGQSGSTPTSSPSPAGSTLTPAAVQQSPNSNVNALTANNKSKISKNKSGRKEGDESTQLDELIELLRTNAALHPSSAASTREGQESSPPQNHATPSSSPNSNTTHLVSVTGTALPISSSNSVAPSSASTRPKKSKNVEESRLDAFLLRHSKRYDFSSPQYTTLLHHLVTDRLLSLSWEKSASREHRLRVLRAIRVLSRDHALQEEFLKYKPMQVLASTLRKYTKEYFNSENGEPPYVAECIVEICSILKRISTEEKEEKNIFQQTFLASLVQLLSTRDHGILQAVLVTLVNLSASPIFVEKAIELPIIEPLLYLLNDAANVSTNAVNPANANGQQPNGNNNNSNFSQSQPLTRPSSTPSINIANNAANTNNNNGSANNAAAAATSNNTNNTIGSGSYHFLAAELLDLFCEYHECRIEIQLLSGNSIFLRLLSKYHDVSEALCLPILRCLANLALEPESSREIRFLGGIQLLLGILAEGNAIPLMGNNSIFTNTFNHNSVVSSNPSLASSSSGPSLLLSNNSTAAASSSTTTRSPPPSDSMLISCCICLTQLALDDENAFQIRKSQGVIHLGLLFLRGAAATANVGTTQPQGKDTNGLVSSPVKDNNSSTSSPSQPPPQQQHYSRDVQAHAGRALRFLYSVERNRKIFRRFFSNCTELFTQFNDIGHYVQNITSYESLVDTLTSLSPSVIHSLLSSLDELRVQGGAGGGSAGPMVVRGYTVQEVLGKGAFGTVYMVQRENGDKQYAMKELPLKELQKINGMNKNSDISGSATTTSADPVKLAANEMGKEVDILSQLDHPNIVRYYSSFLEGNNIYIVMELVEGTSLLDHINSFAEKSAINVNSTTGSTSTSTNGITSTGSLSSAAGSNNSNAQNGGAGASTQGVMPEESIWPLFIQLCLALCYMHMEKRVVHRDLTPSNIMINDRHVLKITDFGLARQTHNNTVLQSAVGTISFSCPEIIMHESYTDKADIWFGLSASHNVLI